MIKLQDFAKEQGVTDRAIQKHIKKYESELEGLYERRGTNGTWLSDEACRILKSKMKVNMTVLDEGNEEIAKLKEKIEKLENRIERKDVIIENLQSREARKDEVIESMKKKQLLLEEKREAEIEEAVQNAEEKLQIKHNEEMGVLRSERDDWKKEAESYKHTILGIYLKKK